MKVKGKTASWYIAAGCCVSAGAGWCTAAMSQVRVANDPDEAAIRRVVDATMQPYMARIDAPGAIVGISTHGRQYFYNYGTARDDGSPFTPTTLVEIGSCTKVFTTTLLTLAAGRHQMDVNAPAQRYMPKGFQLQPQAQTMTPLQLADFTSGMPNSPLNLPPQGDRGINRYTPKDFLEWASKWTPSQPLPAPYLYSNAGIGLLSYLIATATGKEWENQVNTEMLGPLGMIDTELRPSPDQTSRLAQGHLRTGKVAPKWPVFAWYAAGDLRSTAVDMLRFGEANLGHKQVAGQPVSDELIAAMKKAQTPIYTMPNGLSKQGMAWVSNVGTGAPGMHPEIFKDGGTMGFGTVILLIPAKDTVIFIAVNVNKSQPSTVAVKMGRMLR